MVLALIQPRTKHRASITLLFPDPLGPITAVNPGDKGKFTLLLPKDLNPHISILLMCATFSHLGAFFGTPHPSGHPPIAKFCTPFRDKNFPFKALKG
jgi:hypothetical protein